MALIDFSASDELFADYQHTELIYFMVLTCNVISMTNPCCVSLYENALLLQYRSLQVMIMFFGSFFF